MKLRQECVFRLLRDEKRLVSYADSSRRWTLDVIVQGRRRDVVYQEELDRYRKRTGVQISSALITAVFFTVGFTMSGGNHYSREPDQESVLLSKKTAFNAFMVADVGIISGTYAVLAHSPALAITVVN